MKRGFDVVTAALALVVLAPALAVIALLTAASSGRPVLFRQQRVGLHGRDFTLLKFRSMTQLKGAEQGTFEPGSTRRITPFGRFLRRTKLDELPQLWNVVRGDMSLVGPRPEVRRWVEAYPARWAEILQVRPGITDPASIEFRHEEEILAAAPDPEAAYRDDILPRKLALYEDYVRSPSLPRDLGILVRTVMALIAPAPAPSPVPTPHPPPPGHP